MSLKLSKPIDEIKKNIEFKYSVYEFNKDNSDGLKKHIARITKFIGNSVYRGPLFAMTYELAVNGLKAIYKRIYEEFLEKEMSLKSLNYEKSLSLFRAEIDSHGTKNFVEVMQEKYKPVNIKYIIDSEDILIQVINEGEPTKIENDRIQSSLLNCKNLENFQYLFDEDYSDNEEDSHREGAGLGLTIIVMTLRNFGVSLDNFKVYSKNGNTISEIRIPLIVFFKPEVKKVDIAKSKETPFDNENEYLRKMGYYMMRFDVNGNVFEVTDNLVSDFSLTKEKIEKLQTLLPKDFQNEVFIGPKGIKLKEKFENFRVRMPINKDNSLVTFNVHGYLSTNSTVITVWKPDYIGVAQNKIAEDSVFRELKLRDTLSSEESSNKKMTIIYGNISGLADFIQNLPQTQAIPLLNMVFEIIVKSIDRHGGVLDKFMQDSFLARFQNPLDATIASAEIQALFETINGFRIRSGKKSIDVKIGVHSGKAILGLMRSSAVGHELLTGNTLIVARQLSKLCELGTLLISEDTFKLIKENITFYKKAIMKNKKSGKIKKIFFLDSVRYLIANKNYTLQLRNRKN